MLYRSLFKGSSNNPGAAHRELLLSLVVLDGVPRYIVFRVFEPRRFHTALRVSRVLEPVARRNLYLPKRSAILNPGPASHAHARAFD